MSRLALLTAAALALLAAPPAAFADSSLTIKDGEARISSEDPGIGNHFTIDQQGNEIRFHEPNDPAGTNSYPFEQCRGEPGPGGRFVAIYCPKSAIKSIVVEPGPGEDRIIYKLTDIPGAVGGGTGADSAEFSDAADDLAGEQGNDRLSGGGGDDIINGDEGNDQLDGGAGNDSLTGGTSTDTFVGGAGDDTISAADGIAEDVDCGEGNDTANVDTADRLVGCENVTRQNITGAPVDEGSDDSTPPKLEIGGSSSQRVRRRSVRFVATCSEKGLIQAIGYLDAGGINDAMKGVDRKVSVGGGGTVVKLKLKKRHMRRISRDLRKRRRPRVRVTISCVDAAGNTSRARKFWINLRR